MNNKWFIYSGPSQSFVALGDKSVYVNLVVGLKSLRSRLKIAFSPMGCAMNEKSYNIILLHFVAFFHVASLFSTGVDNEKALELTNSTVFHRGRQWKNSRAGQQNHVFIFQPDFNVEISPKNATKHPVA